MTTLYKKIYDKSPIIIQHLFTTLKGYELKKRRYNKLYFEKLNMYKNLQDPIKEQSNQLNKLLKHLKYNIPYYKKTLQNISDEDLNEETLLNLPIITKEDLRKDLKSFVNPNQKDMFKGKTGGTTGKSLIVYASKIDNAKRMAYLDYFKLKHGVKPFSKRASFTGKEIVPYKQNKNVFWRYNYAINQVLYSGFHVSENNIPYYIKSLNKFKPKALDGFPTSIYRIAKYINANNIKLSFKPICIFPTAETLLEHQKKEIEEAFNCPVRNQYASSEGAPFITECENGRLHFNTETGYFNLKDYNIEENLYELVVTSFLNYTTPIVQYKIGDIVEFNKNQEVCDCGNRSLYVEKILGRQSDYLLSKNGKVTSVHLSNAIKNAPNSIVACQFVQEKLNEIIINIVVDDTKFVEKHKDDIVEALKYRFGNDIRVKFNFVEELKKEKSGKTLFIKNLLVNKQ
ncbi:phenylacetate--CoA ligase family protein [Halobacillus sp. Marseille-Q1614]|uniref:phenylacetate--CoA ligase family protein n=1 Tax=Halobacillus sp. Marseille-Q1614 TaxID=2709134 RepID=UPI0015704BF1|nr:phenylacetate--CoA ligase family protein [Halobacillus sp. Marseille-Q1614]